MITYCVTCKNDTETGDIVYVTTKNNRTMMKGECTECGRVKCQFAKTPAVPTCGKPSTAAGLLVPKEGGDLVGVLNTLTSKFKLPLQKFEGELHIPGMNFVGPGTKLEYRLNSDNTPKEWSKPVDKS
jgi:hypothetical protein